MKHKYTLQLFILLAGIFMITSCSDSKKGEKTAELSSVKELKIHENGKSTGKNLKGEKEEEEDGGKKGIEIIADYIADIMKPIDAKESTYEKGYLIREFQKAKQSSSALKSRKAPTATWQERGPANVPGRTREVVIAPNNPEKWYAGSVGGGLWVTEDAGDTWENLTDFKVPNLATSTVAISEDNPETIYLGTGEPFGNLDAI
ncbi:MAG: hypothetical protein WA951_09440, partial [Leeuwenhoekiella sp.]